MYKSPMKAIKVFAFTVPFVVLGIWMVNTVTDAADRIVGWLNICFFGLGLPIGLFHLLDRRPQIIINENGIWDRQLTRA